MSNFTCHSFNEISLMKFLERLYRVEAVTFGMLLACSLLFVVVSGVVTAISSAGPVSMPGGAIMFAMFMFAGLPPATLFFAPIYAFFNIGGVRGIRVAGYIGAVPGLAMIAVTPEFMAPGVVAVVAGLLVGIGTHLAMMKWRLMKPP